ncbi:MAG: hypothetical protein ACFBSG_00470 [Leptolyngbyaceae cyanobacterium]
MTLAEQLLQELRKPYKGKEKAISEAKARSCISRAYYAAFCTARNQLQIQSKAAAVHGEVIKQLNDSCDADLVAAGILLQRLRSQRNTADYDNDALSTYFADAQKAHIDAARAIKLLSCQA